MNDYDEVQDAGSLCLTACVPVEPDCIEIVVAEAYRDSDDLQARVLLICRGGPTGVEYSLDPHEAQALGHLLLSTAARVRRLGRVQEDE